MAIVSSHPLQEDSPSVRVALCVDRDAFDRCGRMLRYLLVGLVDQAVQIRLLSDDPRLETLMLGPVQALWHPPIAWPSASRRIRRIVDSFPQPTPTIIHAMSAGSFRLADAIAVALDADLVVQVTSAADCESIDRLSEHHRTIFLAASQPLRDILETQLRVEPERIVLIRPGVLASQEVACLAPPPRTTTILCTSPWQRHSGVDMLLEALSHLHQKGHVLATFLWGTGRDERRLRRLVHEAGLAPWVTFAYPMGDPTDAMRGADIFVRPSVDTAFAIDTLQAMGTGLATVTLANPLCDYIQDGKTAVVCPDSTAEALADSLETLLLDPPYARRLATAAHDYVRSHHAISRMAERTTQVYRELTISRSTFSFPSLGAS